jgi:hypothetical protein
MSGSGVELTAATILRRDPRVPRVDDDFASELELLVADEAPDRFWWLNLEDALEHVTWGLADVDSFQYAHGSSYRGEVVGDALKRYLEVGACADRFAPDRAATLVQHRNRGGRT